MFSHADAQVLGEHLGGDCARGEADDAALAVSLRPRGLQRVHRGGLACARRTDEQVDLPPGHGDARQRLGLLGRQQVFLARHPLDHVEVDLRGGHVFGAGQEAVLGGEQGLGGEHDSSAAAGSAWCRRLAGRPRAR